MRQRAARGSCVLRVGLPPGADPGSGHTAVRTLNRGTLRCLRPFERPGPVTRRARRLRGTRGPRADAHGGRIAQARAAHNARSGIPRFTVSIWYAAQRPAADPKCPPEAHRKPSPACRRQPLMRGALSLISRPYLRGEPFYNACTALASISPTGM
ncbi:hypothetical protein CFB40_10830 [Burkholderia sp. AU31652]|nr:hypothetical protein CFB40_10830 [Burkholderia sp. AU31652]